MMKLLQDRITLVIGSSSGIGAAVAQSIAAGGAKVIVNYARSSKGAEVVVNEIVSNGGEAIAIQAEAELLKLIPYNRVGVPEYIDKVAVWLAYDDSEYVQGTTIFVDGGMTLYPNFATGG